MSEWFILAMIAVFILNRLKSIHIDFKSDDGGQIKDGKPRKRLKD